MSHENYQNQTCISSGFLVNLLLGGARAENTVKNISGISFSPHTARITTPRGPSFSQLGDFVEVSEMLVDIFISRVEHECFCIQLFNYAVFYQIINQVFCKSKISYKNRFLPRKEYKLDLHYWQILCCLWAWCAPQPAFGFYCLLVSSRRIFVLSLWKKKLSSLFYSSRDVWRESGGGRLALSGRWGPIRGRYSDDASRDKSVKKKVRWDFELSKVGNFDSLFCPWPNFLRIYRCISITSEFARSVHFMKSILVIFALVSADFEPIGLNYQASWGCHYPDTGKFVNFSLFAIYRATAVSFQIEAFSRWTVEFSQHFSQFTVYDY